MVITLGKANAPTAMIRNLLYIQHQLSTGYIIDWERILGELTSTAYFVHPRHFTFSPNAVLQCV